MSAGVWVLLAAVAATLVFGLVWRAREGRVRATADHDDEGTALDHFPAELRQRLDDEPSADVTLVQFSTTFCAPCRHTRILLADFAERTDGVHHVDIDLTDHPEWSTPLGVHRTPTTLALDGAGREIFRVAGVPRREELGSALRPFLP
ncbi:thioredoxin family protein [Saccharopolyspora taberi]|uniref:Thioredoxin family protein n=1 Tax=Saccharopolyspora taberi TaxID=60895 RepID=A0ABN3VMA4_9PSEU